MLSMPTDHAGPDADALAEHVTRSWLRQLRDRVRRWHRRHCRDLPWRGADAYQVWISEIMLQQTTVAAVVPYYERFLSAYPTVEALAAAQEEQVLRHWEGLGYYSRAINLHRTAQIIVADHGGRLPRDVDALQQLPGIGRYTAGAIASFAFDHPAPIVEANTLRLYTRLLGFDGNPRSATGQALLWRFAESVLPRSRPGEFNQALLDLGATVCTPAEPACKTCPVMSLCSAFQSGRQGELPRRAQRPEPTDVVECAVVVTHRGRYLLRRCQPGERWAGLWDFPRFALDSACATMLRDRPETVPSRLATAAIDGVEALTAVRPRLTGALGQLRHSVTRYRITLLCLQGESTSSRLSRGASHLKWVHGEELAQLPLSTTGREIVSRWVVD
jgi:A/G-specific adenine glycosylase